MIRVTYSIRSVLAASLFLPALSPAAAEDPKPDTTKQITNSDKHAESGDVGRVIGAASSHARQDAIIALFRDASDDRIRELTLHPDPGIALTAAWQRILRPLPAKTQERGIPLPTDDLHWFLGFVEGRLRITPPAWWKACLLETRATSRWEVCGSDSISKRLPYQATESGYYAPVGVSVREQGEFLLITVGSTACKIPRETIWNSKGRGAYLVAVIDGKFLYVASYWSLGIPYGLMCFDVKTGLLRWTILVWTSDRGYAYGGHFEHRVSLVTDADTVTVMGMSSAAGPYIESFRKEDGKNLFRFDSPFIDPSEIGRQPKQSEHGKADDKECERLIDQLVHVSQRGLGLNDAHIKAEFLPYENSDDVDRGAEVGNRRSEVGGEPPFQEARGSGTIRKLVAKGLAAVPLLLKHLGDDRKVATEPLSSAGYTLAVVFADEYDFNRRTRKTEPVGVNRGYSGDRSQEKYFLTVGDLCYVALGQIVNRRFSAVEGYFVSSPTHSAALRKVILDDWTGLTRERHKALLIDDFLHPDDVDRQIGAYLRLASYYPEAVEPLVLKQLAEQFYDRLAGTDIIYGDMKPAERKRLFDSIVAKRGEVARRGLLHELFESLRTQEAVEQGNSSPPAGYDFNPRARLAELYGYPKSVKSTDEPKTIPLDDFTQSRFIRALTHDTNHRVGEAVRKIFLEHPDNYAIAPACLVSLESRGYAQFLVMQLNKVHLADTKADPLQAELIRALSTSRQNEVRKRLLEIVTVTTNETYFDSAIPAVDRSHDVLVLKRAREILARLPAESNQGEDLLRTIGGRFPGEAKPIYRSFLAVGTVQRAETMCSLLSCCDSTDSAVEILTPLLDDKRLLAVDRTRPFPPARTDIRVCDRAAEILCQETGQVVNPPGGAAEQSSPGNVRFITDPIDFNTDWNTAEKDQAIGKLKQFFREGKKKTP